ncbi:hypothetical protein BH23ACT9_BH23ACT9_14880 [soil metagenome]
MLSLNAARVLFVGALLLVLYVGLTWALAIEDRPDAASIAAAEAAREQAQSEREEAQQAEEDVTTADEPTEAVTQVPAPVETVPPEELIAAARQPGETTVQVLDAGGGNATTDAVVGALEGLGYQVVAINSSSRTVDVTTVYFTADDEPQAEALRARDPRFQAVEANQGLSEGVDIHVLVGRDF